MPLLMGANSSDLVTNINRFVYRLRKGLTCISINPITVRMPIVSLMFVNMIAYLFIDPKTGKYGSHCHFNWI